MFVGRISYAHGLQLQAEAHARVLAGGDHEIISLTHDPVMTIGRNATTANLLVSEQALADKGIALTRSDRGGDITYHGPEQVLLYPIIHLERAHLTVRSLVCVLEKSMITYLQTLGVQAHMREGAPGVYVGDAKIGFLGLRIRDGISTHGLSLNLGGSLEAFSLTHPCGHIGQHITSVETLTGARPPHEDAATALATILRASLSGPARSAAECPTP